jgi:hypothetical protein
LVASIPFSSFATSIKAEERILFYDKKRSSNDKIRIRVIGYGVQVPFDLNTALKIPRVEWAGICDL